MSRVAHSTICFGILVEDTEECMDEFFDEEDQTWNDEKLEGVDGSVEFIHGVSWEDPEWILAVSCSVVEGSWEEPALIDLDVLNQPIDELTAVLKKEWKRIFKEELTSKSSWLLVSSYD